MGFSLLELVRYEEEAKKLSSGELLLIYMLHAEDPQGSCTRATGKQQQDKRRERSKVFHANHGREFVPELINGKYIYQTYFATQKWRLDSERLPLFEIK
jgi:hypothetical protein